MVLKGSFVPDSWKPSSVVSVLKNIGKRFMATNYRTVSLLYVVNYVFKNLLNNVLIVHLKKCVYGNKFTY